MRWHVMLTLSVLSITLFGCLSKPVSRTGWVDDISVEIWSNTDCVQPNNNIELRVTVTNHGTTTQIVESKEQAVFDIIIRNQGPVVHWSDGKALTPDLTKLELKPGESKAINMVWTVKPPSTGNVFYVDAKFAYKPKISESSMPPSILVSVSVCPGPFGP